MPYRWETHEKASGSPGAFSHENGDPPSDRLVAWPHRPLSPEGFAIFVGITFLMFLVPLFAVIGSAVLWVILPYILGALALTWVALRHSSRQSQLTEVLSLWSDRIEIVRTEPKGEIRDWQANPYWVQLALNPKGAKVENYLTLKGSGREVELGAFLSPEERTTLHDELRACLARLQPQMHGD